MTTATARPQSFRGAKGAGLSRRRVDDLLHLHRPGVGVSARAAVLAPLQYSAILWAAIMGWLVWRDPPTLPIIVGNAIIIGSGLFVATRRRGAAE